MISGLSAMHGELDPHTGGFHTALSEFVAPNQDEAIRYAYLIDVFYRIRRAENWPGSATLQQSSPPRRAC